jgi:hypothetical protein
MVVFRLKNEHATNIEEIAICGWLFLTNVIIRVSVVEMNYYMSSSQSITDAPKLIPKCSFR